MVDNNINIHFESRMRVIHSNCLTLTKMLLVINRLNSIFSIHNNRLGVKYICNLCQLYDVIAAGKICISLQHLATNFYKG